QDYSAGDFSDEANAAIQDILARGRVPIVVGGTGFYLKCLMQGKPKGPRTSPEALAAVRAKVLQVGRVSSTGFYLSPAC
ncbi:zeta_toxin domain-containing protein, partial [Haematococcus lacustris]